MNSKMVKGKVKVPFHLKVDNGKEIRNFIILGIQVNGKTINIMVKVPIHGVMEKCNKDFCN